MFQKNKKNRKGFTLAELLIVVAIIAVLVAIAVPLFVGALNDAEQRTIEANERSLKGMASTEILLNSKYMKTSEDASAEDATIWYVSATYKADEDKWSNMVITPVADDKANKPTGWAEKSTESDGTYSLYVTITKTDLTSFTVGKPAEETP